MRQRLRTRPRAGAALPATRIWRGWLVGWSGMVVAALLNGTFRAVVTQSLLGDTAARQLATVILLGLLLGYEWWLNRRFPLPTARTAWCVGAAWTGLTLAFELGFGRYVEHLSWSTMLADYDVTNGRIWVLVPLALLVLPTVVRTLQARDAQPEGGHDDVSG